MIIEEAKLLKLATSLSNCQSSMLLVAAAAATETCHSPSNKGEAQPRS